MWTALEGTARFILKIHWNHLFDICLMWFLLYQVYIRFRGSLAMRLLMRVFGLWLAYLAAQAMGLELTSFLLWALWIASLILFLMTFQGEIQRIFLQTNTFLRLSALVRRALRVRVPEESIRTVAEAALRLAEKGVGALIVIERRDPIEPLLRSGGEVIGADVQPALIETIFHNGTPYHDGAAYIRTGKIHRVGCVLPLSERTDLPGIFGTRHRAAIGLTERCDALAVVVSEERRRVSAVVDGHVRRIDTTDELVSWLTERVHAPREDADAKKRLKLSLAPVRENWRAKLAVLAVVLLVWAVGTRHRQEPQNFFARFTGGAEESFTVPVSFYNIPEGMRLQRVSTRTALVRLSGNRDILNFLDPGRLRIWVNLQGTAAGASTHRLSLRNIDLPSGVRFLGVDPPGIEVRLAKEPQQERRAPARER